MPEALVMSGTMGGETPLIETKSTVLPAPTGTPLLVSSSVNVTGVSAGAGFMLEVTVITEVAAVMVAEALLQTLEE